jgi:hypothetical protein
MRAILASLLFLFWLVRSVVRSLYRGLFTIPILYGLFRILQSLSSMSASPRTDIVGLIAQVRKVPDSQVKRIVRPLVSVS